MDQLPTVIEILGASSPALLRFDVGAARPRYIGSASELEQKEDGSWILTLPGDAFVGREATPEACQWFRTTTEEEVTAVPALRVSRVPPRQLLPSKLRGSKVLAWAPDLAQFTVLAPLPIDPRSSVETDGAREHRTVQLAALDGSLPFETRALHAGPRRVPTSWLLARAPQTPEEAQVLATTAGAWGGRLLALSPAIATDDDLWPLYATDDGDAPGISSGPVRYARVRTVLEADGSLMVECSEGCALIWRWALPEALAFEALHDFTRVNELSEQIQVTIRRKHAV
ncbi:unnamed protein product [Symbiodinium sp. CCMP2592]|nr:unnamed protein product [Symbiodinium sp. CCMP2592]